MKKVFQQLLFTIAYLAIVLTAYFLLIQFQNNLKDNIDYSFNHFRLMQLIPLAVYVFLGALLGLEILFFRRNKMGKWKINYIRMLIWGIPLLFLIFSKVMYFYWDWINISVFEPILLQSCAPNIFAFVFGYIITTSITKESP